MSGLPLVPAFASAILPRPHDSLSSLGDRGRSSSDRSSQSRPLTDIDLILLATSTPDDLFGIACQMQAEIGATRAVAFDITAACSGFVFALVTAAQFIRTGAYQNVVVIGADVLSRLTDWDDRTHLRSLWRWGWGDGDAAV